MYSLVIILFYNCFYCYFFSVFIQIASSKNRITDSIKIEICKLIKEKVHSFREIGRKLGVSPQCV